jgi:DNA-binding response OmpR family regulator
MTKQKMNILVVDDEERICEVVTSYLEKNGYKTFKAYNAKDALNIFIKEDISLILLDLMLPDLSGEDVCRQIRKISKVPIIMLTAKVEEENILKGLDIGADDYITKPFSPRQMVARVGALLRRSLSESYAVSSLLSFNDGELMIDTENVEVKKNGKLIKLTPNEYKILSAIAKSPNKIFTRDDLIEVALDGDFSGFDRAIDSHIKNLRHKIETDTKQSEYILTVRGVGYKFGGK